RAAEPAESGRSRPPAAVRRRTVMRWRTGRGRSGSPRERKGTPGGLRESAGFRGTAGFRGMQQSPARVCGVAPRWRRTVAAVAAGALLGAGLVGGTASADPAPPDGPPSSAAAIPPGFADVLAGQHVI